MLEASDTRYGRSPALPKESEIDPRLTALLGRMLDPHADASGLPVLHAGPWLEPGTDPMAQVAAAFLVSLCDGSHSDHAQAGAILAQPPAEAATQAAFYRDGRQRIAAELESAFARDPGLAARWDRSIAALAEAADADAVAEATWEAFFPQASGIRGHEDERIAELRERRTIAIERLADDPIRHPAREVLFTSNVLLTVPDPSTDVAALPYPAELRRAVEAAAREPQRHWFDHPIQIGVEPEANELLYGLRGLDAAIAAEARPGRVTCLLSVSVTHDGLAPIARRYVEAELARDGRLRYVDLVVITEDDTRRLVEEVIVPALGSAGRELASDLQRVVGVDGRYGRHYSFLKAVAALWHVAIDARIRATFKIDLDQVFPQAALRAETARSMFDHLCTPLWGATARAADGATLELGLLAGALVNERDIGNGLFTPDVPLPDRAPVLDEHVFFSPLPQAISTRAEMMTRYDGTQLDGLTRALERIHVTGGTNGIRVDALRAHRPFTPSWVGRAEDQAYLLSTLDGRSERLAYVHAAGLIMRHDKEAFAAQSMAAARISKLIGDDIRILVFSAYLDALAASGIDGPAVHHLLDPFSGGFASATPRTLVHIRLALRTLRLFGEGRVEDAREYATDGTSRVGEALDLEGDADVVAQMLAQERTAWQAYYEALDIIEAGAPELRAAAGRIIDTCRLPPRGIG